MLPVERGAWSLDAGVTSGPEKESQRQRRCALKDQLIQAGCWTIRMGNHIYSMMSADLSKEGNK